MIAPSLDIGSLTVGLYRLDGISYHVTLAMDTADQTGAMIALGYLEDKRVLQMNIPYILIAIVALMVLMAVVLIFMKIRGRPLVEPRYGRRIHIGIAIGMTVLMVALWLFYDLPIAILPVLIIPQWITLFPRRESPSAKMRLILALLVGLTVLLVVGTAAFWLLNSRS